MRPRQRSYIPRWDFDCTVGTQENLVLDRSRTRGWHVIGPGATGIWLVVSGRFVSTLDKVFFKLVVLLFPLGTHVAHNIPGCEVQ